MRTLSYALLSLKQPGTMFSSAVAACSVSSAYTATGFSHHLANQHGRASLSTRAGAFAIASHPARQCERETIIRSLVPVFAQARALPYEMQFRAAAPSPMAL
jgi:hypothetical protein